MNNTIKTSYNKIIDKIKKIRSKNNANWVDIPRLAFKYNRKTADKIMSKIYTDDAKIGKLANQIDKIKS